MKSSSAKALECKRGDKKLHRLAKARDRRGRVLDQVKYIKNENGKVLVKETHIRWRWKTYFHKLLNEEEDRDIVLGKLSILEVKEILGTVAWRLRGLFVR